MVSISVIVPIYNAGRRIKRCLRSISKQTYQDFQLIIIDDGSTDATAEEIAGFLDLDEELKKKTRLISKENTGVADTRNLGIELSEGTYIAFIDQDDYIAPDYLHNYIECALDTGSDIVVGGYIRFDDKGKVIHREKIKNTKWSKYIIMAPWAHLYKKSFVKENKLYFLDYGLGEDVYFNVTAYQCTERISILDYEGYRWYYNLDSVSNSRQNTVRKDYDPIVLLNSILNSVNSSPYKEDECIKYFFLRYICWYLLFTVRGSRKELIQDKYDALMRWIRDKYPEYSKQKYIFLKMPEGENRKYYIYVTAFYMLERFGLLGSLLTVFGR